MSSRSAVVGIGDGLMVVRTLYRKGGRVRTVIWRRQGRFKDALAPASIYCQSLCVRACSFSDQTEALRVS